MQPQPTVKASRTAPAQPAGYFVLTFDPKARSWQTVAGYLTETFALDHAAILTALGQTVAVMEG